MNTPLLHHELLHAPDADPERWAFVLHGIYGAARNWNAVFRRVTEERPDWGFVAVDLRGHGQSPSLEPPHTLQACVEDLDRLAHTLPARPSAILGHSFGGKVALLYGDDPTHGIDQVWVVDSTPSRGSNAGSVRGILEVLRDAPGPFDSRDEGVQAVRDHGYPEAVARWMATNLEPRDETYAWRLDPDQMEELLEDFLRTDAWPAVERAQGPELHFIRGTESGILDEEGCHRIRSAGLGTDRVHLHDVKGGHWLNAENPEGLVDLFRENLPG